MTVAGITATGDVKSRDALRLFLPVHAQPFGFRHILVLLIQALPQAIPVLQTLQQEVASAAELAMGIVMPMHNMRQSFKIDLFSITITGFAESL
jgi:hypothetical protein